MAARAARSAARAPLSRERVLRAAIELADTDGVDALTMRRLGQALGVEAMSLYNHVANKGDVLAGMVDVLVGDIPTVAPGPDWRAALRAQAMGARSVVVRHAWAPALILSRRSMSAALTRYMDGATGLMLEGGLSADLVHNAMHVLGSRLLGFTQELFDTGDLGPELAGILRDLDAATYSNIAAVLREIHHDDDDEFAFGLDLVLDGLERLRVPGGDGRDATVA
ncbi:MAG TPA: TetR/AcrR family transcriptional regulator C-terminal domain-containing protein [Candidatus Limnocylindrales bacterium]|nr:TetR/AcrR family transcriptional regulator C-terminal domain-containing protein [Candidatus Limnocylindrales bacterium]